MNRKQRINNRRTTDNLNLFNRLRRQQAIVGTFTGSMQIDLEEPEPVAELVREEATSEESEETTHWSRLYAEMYLKRFPTIS